MTADRRLILAAAAALTLGAAPALAADAAPGGLLDGLKPEVSLRAGVWSHERDLGDSGAVGAGEAAVRIAPRFSETVDAYAEGRAEADSTGRSGADLREGWLRVAGGGATLTLGRQIVVWGRADRLNPTDVLGSRDYTRLLSDDDEQRRGAAMAMLSYGSGPWTVSAVWIPEFRANRFPLDRSRPGVVIVGDQRRRDRGQVGLHLDHAGGGLDWSLSYFEGLDHTRDIAPVAVPPGSPAGTLAAVQQQFPDIRMAGADLAGVHGKFGYRAEAAWTHVRGPDTPFRKNDNLWIVAGVDRTFDSGWNVNLQYSFRRIFDYADPHRLTNPLARAVALQSAAVNNQLDRTQSGVSLRAARSWLNDTLDFEVTALTYFETGDAAVRPKLTYAFSDHVRGTVGADIFSGPQLSYFGRVRDMSAGYVQLVYGF